MNTLRSIFFFFNKHTLYKSHRCLIGVSLVLLRVLQCLCWWDAINLHMYRKGGDCIYCHPSHSQLAVVVRTIDGGKSKAPNRVLCGCLTFYPECLYVVWRHCFPRVCLHTHAWLSSMHAPSPVDTGGIQTVPRQCPQTPEVNGNWLHTVLWELITVFFGLENVCQ